MVEAIVEKQYIGHDQAAVGEWKVAETPLAGEVEGGVAGVLREGRRPLDLREGETRGTHGINL